MTETAKSSPTVSEWEQIWLAVAKVVPPDAISKTIRSNDSIYNVVALVEAGVRAAMDEYIGNSSPFQTRPSWDEWGLLIAETIAMRADCTRRKVGAVIMTSDHSIIAEGYNGAPPGEPGCLSSGACPRAHSDAPPGSSYDTGEGSCIAIHAEQNALLRASWERMKGSTMYVTDEPCDGCLKIIHGTPIERVLWPGKD